ncbi:unnamed protein product [Spirodela intermedia]|uniref:Uncharacterized protein n=1 Tax=Spirodela intermedia TaxID=51605 RepID=A0A7I8KH68_SPIIN|nr:unnamed protein product [Spirodela intermedia]
MALQSPLGTAFSAPLLKGDASATPASLPALKAAHRNRQTRILSSSNHSKLLPSSRLVRSPLIGSGFSTCFPSKILLPVTPFLRKVRASKMAGEVEFSGSSSDEESDAATAGATRGADPFLMDDEERLEWRRKIRQVIDAIPDVEEEADQEERGRKMQRLLAEYPLVVEEDDPDWPEDADGWGFNFDQFFNKITIKNVKKDDDDEDYDSDKEIVWQDDDYIKPIRDIIAEEWEDMVFKDFNPLVILVHNRYKRPGENERARSELERAVHMFWESRLPSPRCAAVDAVVEQDLASALRVSIFPEIIFTKAGKILHRDKVVRTADEWSKMMAFFYYKASRPPWLDKTAGQSQEKIPSLPSE